MIAYYKLLDFLNRNKISKEEFRKRIGIAPSTMAKISKNEPISLSIIDRICYELRCQPGDIIEHIEEEAISQLTGIPEKVQTSWFFDEFEGPIHGIKSELLLENKESFWEFVQQRTGKKEFQRKEIMKELYDEFLKQQNNKEPK